MESPPDAVWRERMRRVLDEEPPGAHLSEDAWQALAERRPLPDDAGEALEHLARCAECRDVLRAVHLLHGGRSDVEVRPRPSGRSTRVAWAAAVAAMVTAGGGIWMVTTAPQGAVRSDAAVVASPASSQAPTSTAAAPPPWLRITVPAMALYSPEALTMRGGTGAPFAEAFATAMQPWQAGRFAEAAQGLAAVTATYPAVAEGHFYRGVALLLSGTPGSAIAPLERATAIAPVRLAPDAWWYLGLARYQQGDSIEAASAFARACDLGRSPACEAAQALSRPTAPRP